MTTASIPQELLTPVDVAQWLGVPVKTLTAWRYERTGPAFTRVGRFVRYFRGDVQSYIDAGRVEPTR